MKKRDKNREENTKSSTERKIWNKPELKNFVFRSNPCSKKKLKKHGNVERKK